MGASLDRLLFPTCPLYKIVRDTRLPVAKSVFLALIASAYLTQGMTEVYRLLFEVFGINFNSMQAQPRSRRTVDEDFVVPELEGERPLTWQQIAEYEAPAGALFAHPRLFRACVPPGMQRFRTSQWHFTCLGPVLDKLAYPRPSPPAMSREAKQARNEELALALQLAFLHPSVYKAEHPRFSNERLEYLGAKVQDLVLAERLLLEYLDGPILWLEKQHESILRNSVCGRYFRQKGLEPFLTKHASFVEPFERDRRLRTLAGAAALQAIHGAAYCVYGKVEVRRLMFGVFAMSTAET
eukprot:TRINITY_DN8770_c0_g1_i1.p2 TRINITY_DN8770_c0_g1~~TRINITY_DN8770_c0_g1_i1.p2  ORF type:complete len:296 (-),score=67.86 TRINITY_DN8770_c0_g1_i1:441-1328(-)